MVYSHDSFIANSKTFSILLQLLILKLLVTLLLGFIDCESLLIVRVYVDCESLYWFCGDNSKTFDDGFNSFEDGVAEL